MFSTSGLFNSVPCPDAHQCKRPQCIFSHLLDVRQPTLPMIPIGTPHLNSQATVAAASPSGSSSRTSTIPTKRHVVSSPRRINTDATNNTLGEPPKKLQKLDASTKKPTAGSTPSLTSTGVPILNLNAAKSQVAIPVRQAMIKTLYEHFVTLYTDILPNDPNLAAEHALAQEQEVYSNSSKLTYRNAVISSVAGLKRRPKPDSITHDSVGTEATLRLRKEQRASLYNLQLTRSHLTLHLLSVAEMNKWGYITEIPNGPGGDNPSEEGKTKTCERCGEHFRVKEEAAECLFHWGKPYSTRISGERVRVYKCCSRPVSEGGGCSHGPHVFSESEPEQLHARHAFTHTRPSIKPDGSNGVMDTALDIVAIDCEMIYSTGGMRVARVSVVDGSGKEVFDELVKMDEGVEVIDFNTRFSGITAESYAKAVLPLASIRRALDAYINSDTIVIGHSLENDLKTLRMIHHTCVDTAILFPHRSGAPYRKALRDLVREHLNQVIQAGGATVGHSSVEDSVATLNLVRWFVLNNKGMSDQAAAATSASSVL